MCVRVYVSAHMGVFVRRWGTCTCLHMCTHGSGCGRVCVGTCVGLHVAYMHICGFCVWDSCACLYTCAHVGLWMWACLCRHMRGSLCMGLMHACMRVRTWVCACGCACLCMCTCVALCVCMHMEVGTGAWWSHGVGVLFFPSASSGPCPMKWVEVHLRGCQPGHGSSGETRLCL